ncbi:plasmid pRiA4b ORF-3 family protein [Paenibacillus mesophilus]|uniref:plasmid pRiA4b ORF-3 family protein n=1 Tax=Paenibacillus mesophilus TaxID=2582849 RepID=UPI00110E04E4|nr:plasmid pRiA4b ORF-3 family protein [Paenibacillus mesophilus]TMV50310.1 plasmid pRiA4b ORF-3 family protein [Paenibacillus mesophilus]
MKKEKSVYQFKITLKGTKPPVWRRIQVPETYTFYDLHVAIQDSMGWMDSHLHEFNVVNPKTGKLVNIGIPSEEDDYGSRVLQGWSHKIAKYFNMENTKATYVYDFGDGWEHTVVLEAISPREADRSYPVCMKGKRACPPEDCGGVWGYQDICEGKHDFQEEYADYDPDYFEPDEVVFEDPKARFDQNFELV